MKIIVIGSKGMLGTEIMNELKQTNFSSKGMDIDDIDITKKEEMNKIKIEAPDIIINCAAYTNVDKAETEKDKAHEINSKGVENLALICKEKDILLIHISTDYVFNGIKESYDENEKKDPINYYGLTKSLGEDMITNNLSKYYIIRTSWLFGKNGKNFVETIKRLCSEKDKIKVVNDQTGRPTYTKDLSKAIINLIKKNKPFGIYHITNSGKCTWYEFAKEIASHLDSNCKIEPCTTKEFPTPAKRPKYSILNNNKIAELRSWKEAVKAYMEEE